MVPNIFISSTIKDLKYLRESIRNTIESIGYNPIMSDFGEIGYLPTHSAEESCYLAINDCQIVIVIVSKQYGSIGKNGLSITHNEYLKAKENRIPIIFLVDKEVLILQKVFIKNSNKKIELPDCDNPDLLFRLIDDFKNSEVNNGFLTFTDTIDISKLLKKQLALIYGKLLMSQIDSNRSYINEIYKDISIIKHQIINSNTDLTSDLKLFSLIIEFLLEQKNGLLKSTIKTVFGSIENAYRQINDSKDFDDFVKISDINYSLDNEEVILKNSYIQYSRKLGITLVALVDNLDYYNFEMLEEYALYDGLIWAGKKIIKTNYIGDVYLRKSFEALKNFIKTKRN